MWVGHTLRQRRGFVQFVSAAVTLIAFAIGGTASAATVVTFVAAGSGDTLIVSNPQTGTVTGHIRLIADAGTSAPLPLPFSIPAQGSQTFPNVLSGFGSITAPAILAVESSDAVRLSGPVLRIGYPERPLTLPVRFNPGTPTIGSLVLGILNGLVRVNIYEHQTSVTPLLSRTFGSSGEQVTRLRYIDLIPAAMAISDGYAEVTSLSGQVVGTVVNPPTRRHAAGRPSTPPPVVSVAGDLACEFAAGIHASVPLITGATYRWSLVNATAQGSLTSNTIDLALGSQGYASLVLETVTNGSPSTTETNVAIEGKPAYASSTATSVTLGQDATIDWTLTGSAPTSQTLSGTDFTTVNLDPTATSYSYRPTTAGPKTYALSANNACGTGSVGGDYAVSSACSTPHIDSFTSSGTVCAGSPAQLTWATTGSGTVTIDHGIGTVSDSGSRAVSPSATTVYTITKTASCGVDSRTTTLTINQLPVISSFTVTPNAILFGDPATLNFTIASGSSWSLSSSIGNSFFPSSGSTNGSLSATYNSGNNTGADKVTLIVTNSCGTVMQTSCVYVNLSILDVPASVCAGTAGHGVGTEGNIPGASYAWTISGGTITSGQGTTAITWTAGTGSSVQLGLTTTLNNGCAPTSDTKLIPIKSTPPDATITAGPSYGCTTHTASVPRPTDFRSTIAWSVTNGSITGGQGTNVLNYTIDASGTAHLNVTVTDFSSGCSATGSATGTANALPTAAVSGSTTVCNGNSAAISAALTGTAPYTLNWSDGFNQTINSGTTATRTVSPTNTTSYTVTNVTDANGCSQAGTGSATVTVKFPPAVSGFTISPNPVTGGSSATINFTLTDTTSWSITSALGNGFSTNSGTGSGSFSITYNADNNTGTDTITLTRVGPCGTTSSSIPETVH
jgi:hypothetical protein